jgi:prolyl oligopeptidase
MDAARVMGDRIVIDYLEDVKSRLRLFTLDGKPAGEVGLPGIGSVAGLSGEPGESEAWFGFSSFNRPPEVYRLDLATGDSRSIVDRTLGFDPEQFVVEQVFYPSADGTRIPMFIVKRADVTGPAPTLLYAYGGFNVSLPPSFSSTRMAWLQAGGVFALANIRGGGEYGSAWHDAARGPKRENAFADFIAAGEWLKANGITGKNQLAIQGGSNGGLLMGVVTNRRPDLFDAVNADVGVMDMLRFDRWGYGRAWAADYGFPDVEEDFHVLRSYSPYHNVPASGDYPAILVTTADTDDRVIPGHSFKYAAALQAADLGDAPHLIRIETRAGHGAGMPVSKIIEKNADVLGFLAHWTGLQPD